MGVELPGSLSPSVLKISISTLIKEGGRKENSSPCAFHLHAVQKELLPAALHFVPTHVYTSYGGCSHGPLLWVGRLTSALSPTPCLSVA